MTGTNQDFMIHWLPSAGASPTLRSGSNGSSTLQRTQAGGGSLGEKTWRLTVDGGFLFFGWRFDLSCCQPKIPPATSVRKDTGRVHIFFAPCRVIQVGFFSHGFKDSCVFFWDVPETLTKKLMFPGVLWMLPVERFWFWNLMKSPGQRRDHILPLAYLNRYSYNYILYIYMYMYIQYIFT